MRYFFILFFLISLIFNGQSQRYMSIEDTYIFKANYKKEGFESKCPCEFKIIDSDKNKCSLYWINISEVYIQRDTTVYGSNGLINVKYIALNNRFQLPNEGEATFIATNSSSVKYLMLVDTINYLNYYDSKRMPYIIGKRDCIRYTLWQKLQLFLRIRVEKIYEKRKRKDKFQANPFERFILNQK